jgi:hypothetical protein
MNKDATSYNGHTEISKNFREYLHGTTTRAYSPDKSVELIMQGAAAVTALLGDDSISRHDASSLGRQVAAAARIMIASRAKSLEEAWVSHHGARASKEQTLTQRRIEADLSEVEIIGVSELGHVTFHRANETGQVDVEIDQDFYASISDLNDLEDEIESSIVSAMSEYVRRRSDIEARYSGESLKALSDILKGL